MKQRQFVQQINLSKERGLCEECLLMDVDYNVWSRIEGHMTMRAESYFPKAEQKHAWYRKFHIFIAFCCNVCVGYTRRPVNFIDANMLMEH